MYETWYKMTARPESGLDIAPSSSLLLRGSELAVMRSDDLGEVILDWCDLRRHNQHQNSMDN